jgi:excisionase family DNA binding protein
MTEMGKINTDRYYRPDEIAELLNVDKSTVYRMIKDVTDPLPAVRIGGNGLYRVHGRELQSWLERHRVKPEEE